jgi:hypothetical protein
MKDLILFAIIGAFFISCDGKQKKEQALKDLDTSQQQLADIKKQIVDIEIQVTKMTGELEVAKDDMDQVKEFHLFRTEGEREQQIRYAAEYKIEVERKIDSLKIGVIALKDSAFRKQKEIQNLEGFLKE